MSYSINNMPLVGLGFHAGWLGSSPSSSYALEGIWSLPSRLGKTHHNWEGDIEPYVDLDDIHFGPRKLTLKLACKANSLSHLKSAIDNLYRVLGDNFTLSHPTHGSYQVGLSSVVTEHFKNGWGEITLALEESRPGISLALTEPPNNAPFGIDGYSFNQLGLVVNRVARRYDLSDYVTFKITQSPMESSWSPGYRDLSTITIDATIKASSYPEFSDRIKLLQAVIGSGGIRRVKYFDDLDLATFCVAGFAINNVRRLYSGAHWGSFNCELIVVQ